MIEYIIHNINDSVLLQTKLIKEKDLLNIKKYLNKSDHEFFVETKSIRRRQEFVTSRILIKEYLNKDVSIYYLNNKPRLSANFKISISHKDEELLFCLNRKVEIGVDIEKIDKKISKLESKFCNDDELINRLDIDKIEFLTMLWSAKEATFKCLKNQQNIYLKDIPVLIHSSKHGTSLVNNLEYKLDFIKTDDNYIICHAEKK